MFRPIELPKRGRKKKNRQATVVPARRTLSGKRISAKDIRRITQGLEETDQKQQKTKKKKKKRKALCRKPAGTVKSNGKKRCKKGEGDQDKEKGEGELDEEGNGAGDVVQGVESMSERPKKQKRGRRRAKTREGSAVNFRGRSLGKMLTPGKKGRDRNKKDGASASKRKPKVKDVKRSGNEGPKDYTREDLEKFTRERLQTLKREQDEVGALHCRIAELEAETGKMTARHLIHKRRQLQKEMAELRSKAERIESGTEISEFCREAASFFYSFDQMHQQDQDQDSPFVPMTLAEGGLAEPVDAGSLESKGAESKEPDEDEEVRAPTLEEEFEGGLLRDEDMEFGAEELVTRQQVSVLVMPEKLQDMISERQRHVTKADMRVLTRGKASAVVMADSFLEKHGTVSKPLCTISDETCNRCKKGKLVVDVIADTLVCDRCRAEQTSTQNNDRNIGYNNSQNMHFNTCRYKRITHFMSCVDRFCGWVGSSKLTSKLLRRIMTWLEAHNIKKIKVSDTEAALKDMDLSKLTIHKTVITARITGIQPPRFTPDERHQLIEMFIAVEAAFSKLRRENQLEGRLNFLNVNYTLYKFVELVSWGQKFLKFFKLLRGKENLAKQDRYWRKVCEVVDFPFIRSV